MKEIPADIKELIEQLAEHVHEAWARLRVSDGWSYGETRDDMLLKHPGLVPYQELPESEKSYDRNTVEETIKSILSLGYEIKKHKEEK